MTESLAERIESIRTVYGTWVYSRDKAAGPEGKESMNPIRVANERYEFVTRLLLESWPDIDTLLRELSGERDGLIDFLTYIVAVGKDEDGEEDFRSDKAARSTMLTTAEAALYATKTRGTVQAALADARTDKQVDFPNDCS